MNLTYIVIGIALIFLIGFTWGALWMRVRTIRKIAETAKSLKELLEKGRLDV